MIRPKALALGIALCGLLAPMKSQAQDCASNLLIVIDRSCSMINNSIGGKTRWDIAVEAINNLMAKNAGKLRFGIGMFPDKGVMAMAGQCVQTTPLLAPAAGNEATVSNLLVTNTPNAPCVTNIDEGIKQASVEPSLFQTDRRSFVVLITDGAQSGNCSGGPSTGDPLTIQFITQMYNNKVPTYVVGFDLGTNTQAKNSLNSFAVAGGLPNMNGMTSFYAANNQAELEATLDQLASLTGGEISLCKGMPCPDNRCLSSTATCTNGFCVEPPADMAGQGGEDLGNGGGGIANGCSCQIGGQSQAPTAALLALLLGASLLLLRRRRLS